LGYTELRSSIAAMINIIGEEGDVDLVLKMPKAFLHLYDKSAREGRKLGHINLIADTEEELFEAFKKLQSFLP